MPEIQTFSFNPKSIDELKNNPHATDWPVVYLLENGSEVYVGQTIRAGKRFKEHYEREDRQRLKRAHVIIDDEFNLSANFDVESWLIQYLVADEKFTLQNGNAGLANHSYFDREKYKAKFELIWSDLQKMGLAKQDLIQLKNTDLFKYSPYKSLTEEQIEIVEKIENELLKNNFTTHIINGDPGTGKSVLASYIAKYFQESEKLPDLRIGLVIPMTSLRKTLKKVFSKIKGLDSKMVMGPTDVVGQEFDLLIVDEAHRLRRRVNLSGYGPFDKANKFYGLGSQGNQLDWIMRSSKSQILFYDQKQTVTPGDVRPGEFTKLDVISYELKSQLRSLGGNDYIEFVDDLLALQPIKTKSFENYDLRYFSDLQEMITEIKEKDEQHGLARLVAGYAWTWESKKPNSQDYDIELDGLKLKWNSTNIDWVNSKSAVNEVGCIHTVQGYDLNYVGVIIGPEISYNPELKKITIDRKKYKDINGGRSLESEDELERYIVNIYKTLLTRGIRGTYIHAVDKNLEEYIKKVI
jgi:DUF2075 family protein/DNA replication protein DnaC